MRDVKAKAQAPATVRPVELADDLSDHMGQILRHADDLLAEWSRFGAQVRGQVERETVQIGNAVANAVDAAVDRSVATTAAHVDRAVTQAMSERVGTQMQSLAAELARLEARTKAASRQVVEQRAGDRKILWGIIGGIALANVLLALVLLRKPAVVEVSPQAIPTSTPTEVKSVTPTPVETPAAAPEAGSAVEVKPDTKAESTGPDGHGSDKASMPSEQGKGEKLNGSEMRGAHGAPSRKR